MFIPRKIQPHILKLATQYPILTITGPRQSGKTTLCKKLFPHMPYISFEDLDQKHQFNEDPHGFLNKYEQGAIFDEVQNVPTLFSYLQSKVDARS